MGLMNEVQGVEFADICTNAIQCITVYQTVQSVQLQNWPDSIFHMKTSIPIDLCFFKGHLTRYNPLHLLNPLSNNLRLQEYRTISGFLSESDLLQQSFTMHSPCQERSFAKFPYFIRTLKSIWFLLRHSTIYRIIMRIHQQRFFHTFFIIHCEESTHIHSSHVRYDHDKGDLFSWNHWPACNATAAVFSPRHRDDKVSQIEQSREGS